MSEDLTLAKFRCAVTFSCPGVWRLNDGRLLIVGAKPGSGSLYFQDGDEGPVMLSTGGATVAIGPDEVANVIDPELLSDYIASQIQSAVEAERERCAKIAEREIVIGEPMSARERLRCKDIAKAIRGEWIIRDCTFSDNPGSVLIDSGELVSNPSRGEQG